MTDDERRHMADMGNGEFDRYLRELYRQDDERRVEIKHEKSVAQRSLAAAAADMVASEEEPWFNERQLDGLSVAINGLRREFAEAIERSQQRILQAVAKCVLPGELAEVEVHNLRARVIQAEEKIERRIAAAMGDDTTVIDLPSFIRRRDAA